MCAVGFTTHDQRDVVAEAAFELADDAIGISEGAALGGVSDHYLTVLAEEHHRCDRGGTSAQRDDLWPGSTPLPTAADRRCGEAGPHVNPEPVTHETPPPRRFSHAHPIV